MSIPNKIDTRIREAEAAWSKVKAAKTAVDHALNANKLTAAIARRLADAARDYVAALDRLVLL